MTRIVGLAGDHIPNSYTDTPWHSPSLVRGQPHRCTRRTSNVRARWVERSCPMLWCSFGVVTTLTGWGRDDQAARVGRLTSGSSPMGAMLSRVM